MKKIKKYFSLKHIIYFLFAIVVLLAIFIMDSFHAQKNYQKELQKTKNELEILQKNIEEIKSQIDNSFLEYNISMLSEIADYNKAIIVPPPKEENTTKEIIEDNTTYVKVEEENTTKEIIEDNTTYVKVEEENITKDIIETTKKDILPLEDNTTKEVETILPPQGKSKLVIIIDDVSFRWQVNKIKAIPFKITPSFLPPSKIHPNTHIYAKTFSNYMIHLPLEAIHFSAPESNTLSVKDSYQTILKRVKYVKDLFSKAKFINNHTGSTFTANKESMIKLFRALKNENLGFVDSKTTPYSKSKEAKEVYDIPLFSRNIFLDNKINSQYIQNQLKKAIKIAKKRGYAIAIGHPHPITLATLKNSKELLKDIEVVYIDELLSDR